MMILKPSIFLLAAIPSVLATTKATYLSHAVDTLNVLNNQFLNQTTGLWKNWWWQSGNIITTIGDLCLIDQAVVQAATTQFNATYTLAANRDGASHFLDGFYDDEGWWALGWIRAYDVTQDSRYLTLAESIFKNMLTGQNATCGGEWWNKKGNGLPDDEQHNAAISNELFLQVAASLANRVPDQKSTYLNYAQNEWSIFNASGVINSQSLVNEGIHLPCCCNNNGTVWTYAQGVIVSALVELNKAAPDASLLAAANTLAQAGIQLLTQNGILTEHGSPGLSGDSAMFKGPFVRAIHYLQQASPNQAYVTFLQNNADTMWASGRNTTDGTFGPAWQGPPSAANPATMASALDLLVAAAAVSS